MDKKKIEDFITRLSDPNLPEDQQSFILQSEDALGGASANEGCTNSSAAACGGSTNKSCVNNKGCTDSKNIYICENNFDPTEPPLPSNASSC